MPSIDDWAARAADVIYNEIIIDREYDLYEVSSEERIAAIIALHAEPLIELLRQAHKWSSLTGLPRRVVRLPAMPSKQR